MDSIYIFKIINRMALVFALMNFVTSGSTGQGEISLVFLWCCIITYAVVKMKNKNKALSVILSILIFAPIIRFTLSSSTIFKVGVFIFSIYISWRGFDEISYGFSIEEIKKGISIIAVLFAIALIGQSMELFEYACAGFTIIYLVSAVLLLRIQRYADYVAGGDEKSLNYKANLLYPGIILTGSLILSMNSVRKIILNGISILYRLIIHIIIACFSWLIYGIGYIISFVIYFLRLLMSKLAKGEPPSEEITYKTIKDTAEREKSRIELILNNELIMTIAKIGIVVIVLYIVIKMVSKRYNKLPREEVDYIENKEFINVYGNKGKKLFQRITSFFKVSDEVNDIRKYYRKFMKICKSEGMTIKPSDTTLDINNRASLNFKTEVLQGIRNIYIKIRYGAANVNPEDVKNIKVYINTIKSDKENNN